MEPGTKLGPYEITEQLGAGGMGKVYLAEDTRLGHKVAIKVLPAEFASDPERLARFEREARAAAALNHPHIAAVFDVGVEDDTHFMVQEYLEGDTLREPLGKGALPLKKALGLATEIAEALAAAHAAGIIHRDLKPENIFVTKEGHAKVLDFGLAKLTEVAGAGSPGGATQSPTMMGTVAGQVMGTAGYMAPEQVEGGEVDQRVDLFAFGCVLYEMASGRRAFAGRSIAETLAHIQHDEPPPIQEFDPSLPDELQRIVRKNVAKEPDGRYQGAGDLVVDLRALAREVESGAATTAQDAVVANPLPLRIWQRPVPAIAAMLLLTATAVVVTWNLVGTGPNQATVVTRLTLPLPEGQRQPRNMSAPLAISPDGTLLAYAARDSTGVHLFLRPLDSFDARKIPDSLHADAPFFSPNGQWVGFVAAGQLRKVSISGGSPLTITRASPFGASWGLDHNIVFTPTIGSGLFRVPADGGTPEQLTQPDYGENGYAHVWSQHLPGGRHVLFTVWIGLSRVLDPETREWHAARAGFPGGDMYLYSGHIVYVDELGSGAFLAAPFDLQELAASGSAVPVLDDVRYLSTDSARPHIAISQTGTAVYASDEIGEATLMWVDREGLTTPIRRDQRMFAGVRLSPNGETVVFHDEKGNLWTLDIERGAVDPLTRSTALQASDPAWNPDGRHVTFSSNIGDSWDLYEIDVAERGEPCPLLIRDFNQFPASWSADGRLLPYFENHPETGTDIWILPRGEEPVPVLTTEANEGAPALSPDGLLLAYVTDESGRLDVFVRTYPEGEVRGVSLEGGEEPQWSRDGRELFYHQGDRLLSVKVTTEPELDVSVPQELFEMPFAQGGGLGGTYYDVSPDGERFLVVSDRSTTEFTVILNWFEELNRLVPTDGS